MTTHEMDQAKAEAFAGRLMDVLNGGALALMISIDHRTGLFDAMAGLPPPPMAEDSGQTVVSALTDSILPLVPGLSERLENGIDVMDVGCGSGRALNLMARRFPNSRFVGYDLSEEAISRARAEAAEHGTTNVRFEVRDVTDLGEEDTYDLVTTFDAIHDQAKPVAVLAGIAGALRADGVYLMQDIAGSSHLQNNMDHPLGPFMYTVSTMHCMTVSLAQGGRGFGHDVGRGGGIGDVEGGRVRGGRGRATAPRLPKHLLHRDDGLALGAGRGRNSRR